MIQSRKICLALFSMLSCIAGAQTTVLDWYGYDALPSDLRLSINPSCPGGLVDPLRYYPSVLYQNQQTNMMQVQSDRAEVSLDGSLAFSGDVNLVLNKTQVSADSIIFDAQQRESHFIGNAILRQPGIGIGMQSGWRNFNTSQAEMTDGFFALYDSQLYGSATHAIRSENGNIRLNNTLFTRCNPADPFWQLSAKELTIDYATGDASAWHTVLSIKGVPVLYMPWISYPIDERRKTGFLFPSFSGYGLGANVEVPFYWNIRPNVDATLVPQFFLSSSSILWRNEFRYLTKTSTGTINLNYMPQQQRGIFQFANQSQLTPTTQLEWQLDYASDENYWTDFELLQDNKQHYDQWLKFKWQPNRFSASVLIERQALVDNATELTADDARYLRLPQIDLAWRNPNLIDQIGLNYQSSFTYFLIDDDEGDFSHDVAVEVAAKPEGIRFYNQLELNFPTSLAWLNVDPKLGIRSMSYKLRDYPDYQYNLVPYMSIDGTVYIERDWWMNNRKYRHTIEPQLYMAAVPFVEQDDLPNFDTVVKDAGFTNQRFSGYDRVGDMTRIGLKMTSRWVRLGDGLERWRFSLGQYFKLRQERITVGDTIDTQQDFSAGALSATANARLTNYWSANVDSSWRLELNDDQVSYQLNDHNIGLYYRPASRAFGNLSYTRKEVDDEPINQIQTSFQLPITYQSGMIGALAVEHTDEYGMQMSNLMAGMEWDSCCWAVRILFYEKFEPEENKNLWQSFLSNDPGDGFFIQFSLKGLGGYESRMEDVLTSLPGYKGKLFDYK